MNRLWTWAGLGVVALAAAVLSFASLRSLAVVCGTPAGLAWLLPVCLDAAALVATRLWLGEAPEKARSFARTLALGMIGLSVLGNGLDHFLSAYQLRPAWWSVVAVAAVPPAVLGAVAHLAALAVTSGFRLAGGSPLADTVSVTEGRDVPHPDRIPPGGDLVARAAYLVAAGEAEGAKVGRGTVAKTLGISENQARQVLRQVAEQRTPTLHAVGGEQL